jgi:hypothetical protein
LASPTHRKSKSATGRLPQAPAAARGRPFMKNFP